MVPTGTMLAVIEWPILVLIAIVAITMLTAPRYRRLIRNITNSPSTPAEFERSVQALLKFRRSWLPYALYWRWTHAGDCEAILAHLFAGVDQQDEVVRWCDEGVRRARTPRTRVALHRMAANAHARMRDRQRFAHHLAALEAAARTEKDISLRTPYVEVGVYGYVALGDVRSAWACVARSPELFGDKRPVAWCRSMFIVLQLLGRTDDILRLAEPLLPHAAPDAIDETQAHANSATTQGACSLPGLEWDLCFIALDSARDGQRWDTYERLVNQLDAVWGTTPSGEFWRQSYRAVLYARNGDRERTEEAIRRMDAIVEAMPDGSPLFYGRAERGAFVWQQLGDHHRVLAELDRLDATPTSPLFQSSHLACRARSLEALGRADEAAECRRRAAALVPAAHWNNPPAALLPSESEIRAVIDSWQLPETTVEPDQASTPASIGPIPPVASGIAYAIVALAVAALVPILGIVPTIPLAVLSIVGLALRNRPRHDRRVALAGLLIAIFAGVTWAVSATSIVRQMIARTPEEPATTAPASQPADPELVARIKGALQDIAAIEEPTTRAEGFEELIDSLETDRDWSAYHAAWDLLTRDETNRIADADKLAAEQSDDTSKEVTADASDDSDTSLGWYSGGILIAVLIVSLVIHEIGHAVAAYWAGDPTARDHGRFSLNPIRHLDPFGSVILPLLLIILPGDLVFGWAKPVPFRLDRLRRPRWGQFTVSIAGVTGNLFLALAATDLMILLGLVVRWGFADAYVSGFFAIGSSVSVVGPPYPQVWAFVFDVLRGAVLVNLILLGLNLIPIPPLDGFGVLRSLAPTSWQRQINKLQGVGLIVLLILLLTDALTYFLMPAVLLASLLLGIAQLLVA